MLCCIDGCEQNTACKWLSLCKSLEETLSTNTRTIWGYSTSDVDEIREDAHIKIAFLNFEYVLPVYLVGMLFASALEYN